LPAVLALCCALGCSSASARDDASGAFALPGCLKTLTAACPPDGLCGEEVLVSTDGRELICDVDAGTQERVTEVRKADGTPCYTFVETIHPAAFCEGLELTWKTPAGETVAHGSTQSAGITCDLTGESASCRTGQDCRAVGQACRAPTR
jgi:hypothetical protein